MELIIEWDFDSGEFFFSYKGKRVAPAYYGKWVPGEYYQNLTN
jgi:hypothetical protein